MKELLILPDEEPSDLNGCNCDIYSSKRSRDVTVTIRGFSDEVIVVVKLEADEDAVTYQRIKLSESAEKKNGGDEGRNTLRNEVFFFFL